MQFHWLILILFCLINGRLAAKPLKTIGNFPRPPQSNPNRNTEFEVRVVSNPMDPIKHPISVAKPTNVSSDSAACNMYEIIHASKDSLVQKVKASTMRCVDDVFDLSGTDALSACNEDDVTTVAKAFYDSAYNYDPVNPSATEGIISFIEYVRGCFFIQANQPTTIGNYSSNVLSQVRYALDVFLNRPNLVAKNDKHYKIFTQAITLVSNSHDSLNYMPQLSQLLEKLGNVWNFESTYSEFAEQGDVVNAIFDIFYRSHYEEDKANSFYAKNRDAPKALNEFMNRQSSLLNTKNEYLLRNAGSELARFLKYNSTYTQASGYVKSQLGKYTSTSGEKVWAAMGNQVDHYDQKNCAQYNMCSFKAELQSRILPYTKTCPVTHQDTFKIRAQSISENEMDAVCKRLKDQESYFHNLVKTNWKPVDPDTNKLIEVIIFNEAGEYKVWANLMFGISTDNGGMYLEGDPSIAGNIARYFCYEKPQNGQFDVWNLEHEFTHYLDGRYDMLGDFGMSSTGRTIWWVEGFAEYAANKDKYPTAQRDCKSKKYSLTTILSNTYNSGTERIYYYGYLAARFMFENHRNEVDTILGYFRSGKYADYESFLSGITNRYDEEFVQWCGKMQG